MPEQLGGGYLSFFGIFFFYLQGRKKKNKFSLVRMKPLLCLLLIRTNPQANGKTLGNHQHKIEYVPQKYGAS